MKKSLSIVSIIFLTMFSIINSANAVTYYYFEKMSGLIMPSDSAEFNPFTGGSSEEPSYTLSINAPDVIPMSDLSETIQVAITLSSSEIGDLTGVVLTKSFDDGSQIILDEENTEISGSDNDWLFDISRLLASPQGTTAITLTASIDVEDSETLEIVSVTVSKIVRVLVGEQTYICDAVNPLNGVEIEDGYYLLGGSAGNSLDAKAQLLCMSQHQSTAINSNNYKLTADVFFSSNEKVEDWNGDGTADGVDLLPEDVLVGGWIPLGGSSNFTGDFDGRYNDIDHVINNIGSRLV